MLERTLTPNFAIASLMKGAPKWMSALAFPVAFEKRSMSAGSPFLKDFSLSTMVANFCLCLWILVSFLDPVSFHTSLQER